MIEEMKKEPKKSPKKDNRVEELEKEVKQLRDAIIRISHYTGTDICLKDVGFDPKELFVPSKKDMKKYA